MIKSLPLLQCLRLHECYVNDTCHNVGYASYPALTKPLLATHPSIVMSHLRTLEIFHVSPFTWVTSLLHHLRAPKLTKLEVWNKTSSPLAIIDQPAVAFFQSCAATLEVWTLRNVSLILSPTETTKIDDNSGDSKAVSTPIPTAASLATPPMAMMMRMESLIELSFHHQRLEHISVGLLLSSCSSFPLQILTIQTSWHNIDSNIAKCNSNGEKPSMLLHHIAPLIPSTVTELKLMDMLGPRSSVWSWHDNDVQLLVTLFKRLTRLRCVDFGLKINRTIIQRMITRMKQQSQPNSNSNSNGNSNSGGENHGHSNDSSSSSLPFTIKCGREIIV
jgi:hypothetical protein